ncbi:MAG: hypothetical protein COA78_12880 [Blastopirellula sp.]|nr:MAG: hypothetical protein COA78_12880 [Blastopirellula sp.]
MIKSADNLSISLFKRTGRKNYYAEWTCPTTGKKLSRSTGESDKRKSEKARDRLVQQIMNDAYGATEHTTWDMFFEDFQAARFPDIKETSQREILATNNKVLKIISPATPASMRSQQVMHFRQALTKLGLTPNTVNKHLRNIKTLLRFAKQHGYIQDLPAIEMIKKAKASKGRPLTKAEVAQMLEIAGSKDEKLQELIEGLSHSGLRIGEACQLTWEQGAFSVVKNSSGRMLYSIDSEAQKSGKDESVPLTPRFAQWLNERFPDATRRTGGHVFVLCDHFSEDVIGRKISAIGKGAGIKVSANKCASAHDLRRTCASKLAMEYMPAVLKALMRHADIGTTMKYYANSNLENVLDVIYPEGS